MILPFNGQFDRDDPRTVKAPELAHRFHLEADGILRWFVEGYMDYKSHGIAPPVAAVKAAEAARSEEDWLTTYIDARLTITPTANETFAAVYDDYKVWCAHTGDEMMSKAAFGSAISDRIVKERVEAVITSLPFSV